MTEETQAQTETQAPSLSLTDIAAAVQIIDICSERGAFKGGELESVGQVRNRLVTFVQANQQATEEVAPDPIEGVETVEGE